MDEKGMDERNGGAGREGGAVRSAKAAWLGFALVAGAFAWLWLDYRSFWLDDAFITFRYAAHLAEGLGPVFNDPGVAGPGARVEGYTSFAWMLLSAAAFSLAPRLSDPGTALGLIKALGFGLSLFTLYRVWTFPTPTPSPSRDPAPGRPVRRWLVVLLATQPVFVANAGDGMETPLFSLLLLECARSFGSRPSWPSGLATGLLAAALVWTRPEALPLLVALPVLLLWARGTLRSGRAALRPWLTAFASASVLPVLAHSLWRLSYYGELLPNTYYAKATGSLARRLDLGTADLTSFLGLEGGVPSLALWLAVGLAAVAAAQGLRASAGPLARAWTAGLCLAVASRVAFDLWSGSEVMGVHRFLAPLLPPLFVLADEGARKLAQRGGARNAIALACVLALVTNVAAHRRQSEMRGNYERGLGNAHIALGRWLAEHYSPDTWIALGDAGALPFYSALPTIDLWGLNDAEIARLPGEYGARPGLVSLVFERAPDVLVLWNRVPLEDEAGKLRAAGGHPFDTALFQAPELTRHYRFVREFTFRRASPDVPGYYLNVFERKEEER